MLTVATFLLQVGGTGDGFTTNQYQNEYQLNTKTRPVLTQPLHHRIASFT
jgi:hypothetical protein